MILIQDRLAGWVSDLTTLHELTERLARTGSVDAALNEVVRAGAALVGSSRGLVVLEPAPRADERVPSTSVGLGLSHADIGQLETVPREASSYGRLLDDTAEPATAAESVGDVLGDPDLDALHRDVALRLGYGATYAVCLTSDTAGRIGAAVWFYDEPAEPVERQRHLVGLYARYAAEHLARLLELETARAREATIADELLPSRLPRVPGVRLAVRHRTSGHDGGDWYDALPLPEGALGLAVGSVSGSGPSALAAMGRLRASLRAYAVMEGEDPVAVLSDLELLLRLTEPARTATALFAYAEPEPRRIVLAGAGHAPPLIVGSGVPSSSRRPCRRRWGCCPAGRRRAWSCRPRQEKRCCCTRTACCGAPATRWTGPSRGCTRRRRASPGASGTIRGRSPTMCCGWCCRTGSTGPAPPAGEGRPGAGRTS